MFIATGRSVSKILLCLLISAMKVHISDVTAALLVNYKTFVMDQRGEIDIKVLCFPHIFINIYIGSDIYILQTFHRPTYAYYKDTNFISWQGHLHKNVTTHNSVCLFVLTRSNYKQVIFPMAYCICTI